MAATQLLLDERLDELDPLRHLRQDHHGDALVPIQPESIQDQVIELSFSSSADSAITPISIKLAVDASPGCGGIAWPAGEVLSAYIARNGPLGGKSILELGSGTGLVGLIAGALGGNVWITDQMPLLEIMSRNVLLNKMSDNVHVMELNWGDPLPAGLPNFDIILAADCVYFEPAFPLLVDTLCQLAIREQTPPDILFCYKKRRKADKRFFTLLKKHFTWLDVTDDPHRERYSRDAISLLRLTRKQ